MDVREVLIALNAHPRIQRAAACRLAADPPGWLQLPSASAAAASSLGVPAAHLERALEARGRAGETAAAELRGCERHGCRIVTRLDSDYPAALLDHPLPPPVLYVRGTPSARPAVAMVGSRRMDSYGREVAELFARDLARAGVCVVSGFALGVDQAAHRAALAAGGETVAVLGCGIDIAYPARSRDLADRIAGQGALLTEFPLGREPRAWHFPIRNRVIAALSLGTLVVQAKERSGSLITAHRALDLGREVFAVPGGIFDVLATGTNSLIADGAHLVASPLDVLEVLAIGHQKGLFDDQEGKDAAPGRSRPRPSSTGDHPDGDHPDPASSPDRGPISPDGPAISGPAPTGLPGKLLRRLRASGESQTAEHLATELEQGVDAVLGGLLELELGGWVERAPGPVYLAL